MYLLQENGDTSTSFVSVSLQKMEDGVTDEAYSEEVIKATAGTMYTGEQVFPTLGL